MQEKLENYIEELSLFDDIMDKYEYIIDLGKRAPSLRENEKIDEYKIQGCQSSVWIIKELREGKLYFKTDSDTVIVRGLARILGDIFAAHLPQEILNFDTKELEKLGLQEIISPVRLNGFTSMINKIYQYAKDENRG
ncbi:MAG: SufE family protein [Sulfurospirillum sp.]|nr:SufE family protein [Sulfurospirillum sp.]